VAIILVAAAGIIPVLVNLVGDKKPAFDAAWASIAIAAAAFCVVLDRFFGFSTAWIRFITTQLEIARRLDAFHYDWRLDRANWIDGKPSRDQVLQTLGRCKAFLSEINGLIQEETSLWVAEFRDVLAQIDQASRAKAAAAEQSALNITVSGVETAQDGWLLSIDGGAPTAHLGDSAAVSVLPGVRIITVSAQIGDKRVSAEKAVAVVSGAVAQVAITL
jgi:hypothetical protein